MDGNARQTKEVLVYVGWDLVGDGILKLPFIRALRAAWPDARITWVAGKRESAFAGPLAPMVEGLLDEVIEHAGIGASPRDLLTRPKALGDRRFDVVIDTQKVALASLSLWRVRHQKFISPFARFALSTTKPAKGYKWPRHIVRQLLDLAELATGETHATPARIELPVSDADRAFAADLLPDGPVYVGLAPGSGGRPKCWPLENFVAVARTQASAGRVPVVLLGPQEGDWHAEIKAAVPEARFPLQEATDHGFAPLKTVALGERLAVAVSNDSGVGHMLASSGTALVSLFGPTVPAKFTPLAERLALLRAQDFAPAGAEDAGAMRHIPVEAVNDALSALLP